MPLGSLWQGIPSGLRFLRSRLWRRPRWSPVHALPLTLSSFCDFDVGDGPHLPSKDLRGNKERPWEEAVKLCRGGPRVAGRMH